MTPDERIAHALCDSSMRMEVCTYPDQWYPNRWCVEFVLPGTVIARGEAYTYAEALANALDHLDVVQANEPPDPPAGT